MADRRDLQSLLNTLSEAYNATKTSLDKDPRTTVEQKDRLNKMYQNKVNKIKSNYGDDLMRLNQGQNIPVAGATLSGSEIDQTKLPDVSKQKLVGKDPKKLVSVKSSLGGRLGALASMAGASAIGNLLPEKLQNALAEQDLGTHLGRAIESFDQNPEIQQAIANAQAKLKADQQPVAPISPVEQDNQDPMLKARLAAIQSIRQGR